MKSVVMISLFSLGLFATSCNDDSTKVNDDDPRASSMVEATATSSLPSIPRLLSFLPEELSDYVKDQPWATSAQLGSRELLVSMITAQDVVDVLNPSSVEETRSLLEFASMMPWYNDGLAEKELRTIAAAYDIFGNGAALANSEDLTLPLENAKHALTQNFALIVELNDDRNVFLVVVSADASIRESAVALVRNNMPRLEEYFGPYPGSAITIVIEESKERRCVTYSYFTSPIMLLTHACLDQRIMAHELSHTFAQSLPTWYREGIATIVGETISGVLPNAMQEAKGYFEAQDKRPAFDLENREHASEDFLAGLLFLGRLKEIVGDEVFKEIVRGVPDKSSGSKILSTIVSLTPTGSVEEVEELIDDFSLPR